MEHHAWAVAPTIRQVHIAMAFVALTTLALSGCRDSSESSTLVSTNMNNPTETSAELIDPSGEIAQIEFYSADADAMYQCLLSAALASATSRGLQAYPVINERDRYNATTGVYATWCKTVGTGEAVNADIASCKRYLNDGVSAPGTETLNLYANMQSIGEDGVNRVILSSIKIPAQGPADFKVKFTRSRGENVYGYINYYRLSFVPFDGNAYNENLSVFVGRSYGYADSDINLSESYIPDESVAEHMNLLSSSAIQFKITASSHIETLRTQVESAINADNSLDDNAKQIALAKATTEFDRRINLIDENSETLHRLTLEQFAIEQCG